MGTNDQDSVSSASFDVPPGFQEVPIIPTGILKDITTLHSCDLPSLIEFNIFVLSGKQSKLAALQVRQVHMYHHQGCHHRMVLLSTLSQLEQNLPRKLEPYQSNYSSPAAPRPSFLM